MTNTDLLNKYIDDSGYKRSYIAKVLGISRASLTAKVGNSSEFKASEIEALCRLLNIVDPAEKENIFFASKVD